MKSKPTSVQKEQLIQGNATKREGVFRAAAHIDVGKDRKSSKCINSSRLLLMVLARRIVFLF